MKVHYSKEGNKSPLPLVPILYGSNMSILLLLSQWLPLLPQLQWPPFSPSYNGVPSPPVTMASLLPQIEQKMLESAQNLLKVCQSETKRDKLSEAVRNHYATVRRLKRMIKETKGQALATGQNVLTSHAIWHQDSGIYLVHD